MSTDKAQEAVGQDDARDVALEALLTRIDDAHENYERFGAVCEFEGQPMIHADTLTEIITLRGEYHVAAISTAPASEPVTK